MASSLATVFAAAIVAPPPRNEVGHPAKPAVAGRSYLRGSRSGSILICKSDQCDYYIHIDDVSRWPGIQGAHVRNGVQQPIR